MRREVLFSQPAACASWPFAVPYSVLQAAQAAALGWALASTASFPSPLASADRQEAHAPVRPLAVRGESSSDAMIPRQRTGG